MPVYRLEHAVKRQRQHHALMKISVRWPARCGTVAHGHDGVAAAMALPEPWSLESTKIQFSVQPITISRNMKPRSSRPCLVPDQR